MNDPEQHIAHCSACACKMDISSMDPYTNVICPDCGHHTRVKCEMGHYLLTSRHAAGGMSMVFVARDTTLQRDVAIKILNDEYSRDEKRMIEFEREAKITAALSHPHIVRVFTVGQSFGHYYIAMELVPGDNLEQKIAKGGAIGEEEMLPIALEVISGLRAAKSAGLIHRDVKPGNILFDEAGHVKIVDFGLALVTMGGKVKAEEIWATPYYVPPEALDGLEEDFRSDIYALGATLYHALSGKPPLPSDAKSTREVRKAKEEIAPLQKVAPWLNSATCHLVDKAMQLRPEDRYHSYVEMEDAWNAAFQMMKGGGAEEPIHSQERLRRRANGGKGMVGLVVAGVVAFILVAGVIAVFLNKGDGQGKGSDKMANNGAGDGQDLSEAGLGQSNLLKGDGDYDPEDAVRVGRLFRSSHALLKQKNYVSARMRFAKLTEDPAVREPLSSWARIEWIVASWLTGDPRVVGKSLSHFRQKNQSHPIQDRELNDLAVLLSGPSVIRGIEVGSEPMEVVKLMAMALKNWELGAWDEAVPLFKKVEKHPLPAGNPLAVYREIASMYLHDFNQLKSLAEMKSAANEKEADSRLASLKKQLKSLRTKGRARFHIRVWQLRLHRQIKQMQNTQKLAKGGGKAGRRGMTYQKVQPAFKALVDESKFAKASDLLQNAVVKTDQKKLRDSWVYLTDSASAFLGLLEENIPASGIAVEIKRKGRGGEEKVYHQVVSAKSGGVMLKEGDTQEFLTWGELDPASVISLFQAVLKTSLTTPEGQLHTEWAICYAWLTGLEDKAQSAAKKLAHENASFKKRWEKSIQVIFMNQ